MKLMEDLTPLVYIEARKHRLEWSTHNEVGSDTAMATINPVFMHQALLNLVVNAIKYTPEGGSVSVTLRSDARVGVLSPGPSPQSLAQGTSARSGDPTRRHPSGVDEASGAHPEAGGEQLENGYVFEVTDTGAAIPAESLAKIWEPFYTTGDRKGVSHNVGLGLAFVKNVMTQHHGTITIDSEVGKGTCFRLWVPVG